MDFIQILKWIAVAVTLTYGLCAMIKPNAIKDFSGLETSSPQGTTEIRSSVGGTFVGLGLAAIILNSPVAFTMLGICFAAIAVIRTLSIVLDKSVARSNAINLVAETVLAILFVL